MTPIRNTAFLLIVLLAGCAQLGLATPQSFDEKIAYAYGTNTAIRQASTAALDAGKISSTDMRQVMAVNDQAGALLDAARAANDAGHGADADAHLRMATSILTSIQAFLDAKGVKASINEGVGTWA